MTHAYWAQFDQSELDDMQGIDRNAREDDDLDPSDYMDDEERDEDEEESCPRCGGGGCNYCLMLSY
jgi:hypothetical protein